jgi:putative CocE/NonD family hydrolase
MFFLAQRFCERGYYVLVTDTRGRCGSGGEDVPLELDAQDGADTVAWVRSQPWCGTGETHRIGMWGMSFLGLVQYAALTGRDGGDATRIDALCPILASSQLHGVFRPGGGVAMGLLTRWHYVTSRIDENTTELGMFKLFGRSLDKDTAGAWELPLDKIDAAVAGERAPTVFGSWLVDHTDDDATAPFWLTRDHASSLATAPPTVLIAGLHDFFLGGMLRDYARLTASGRHVRLVLGPWAHFDPGAVTAGLREAMWWFEDHLRPTVPAARARADPAVVDPSPVQVHVTGENRWHSFIEWPPRAVHFSPLHFASGFKLTRTPPGFCGGVDSFAIFFFFFFFFSFLFHTFFLTQHAKTFILSQSRHPAHARLVLLRSA